MFISNRVIQFLRYFQNSKVFSTSRRYTLGNFHRKLLKPKKDPRHHRNILENSIAIFPTSESVSRQKKGGGGAKKSKNRGDVCLEIFIVNYYEI